MARKPGRLLVSIAVMLALVDLLAGLARDGKIPPPSVIGRVPENHREAYRYPRIVALTTTTGRYHSPWCDRANNNYQMSLEMARRRGYKACSQCGG